MPPIGNLLTSIFPKLPPELSDTSQSPAVGAVFSVKDDTVKFDTLPF